jgi:hypothetical protein
LSLRVQADADLKYAIVKAVRQREPSIDFASAAESGLEGLSDPELLERAAQEDRILVSHDRRTMDRHAYTRPKSALGFSHSSPRNACATRWKRFFFR